MAKIRKHVTRNLVTIDADRTVAEAARLLSQENIGSVAVTAGDRVVGLVTERGLVHAVLAAGLDGATPVRDVMSVTPAIPIDAEESMAAEMMRRHNTRHLLVEEGGRVVGVISMRDVIELMIDEKQFLIGQLHTYIFGRESVAAHSEP